MLPVFQPTHDPDIGMGIPEVIQALSWCALDLEFNTTWLAELELLTPMSKIHGLTWHALDLRLSMTG